MDPWAGPGRGEGGGGCCCAPALSNTDVERLAEGPLELAGACARDNGVGGP